MIIILKVLKSFRKPTKGSGSLIKSYQTTQSLESEDLQSLIQQQYQLLHTLKNARRNKSLNNKYIEQPQSHGALLSTNLSVVVLQLKHITFLRKTTVKK